MSKNKVLRFQGQVYESLPDANFRVRLSDGREVLCHLAGKLRMFRIKILPGDTVTVEGALWSPAPVVANPLAEGAFLRMKGPVVPLEVSADDPRLWENVLDKQ